MTTAPEETEEWLARYLREMEAQRAARPPIEQWTTLNLIVEVERARTIHAERHAWDATHSGPDGAEFRAAWRELIHRWHYDADPVAAEYVDGARHHLDLADGA